MNSEVVIIGGNHHNTLSVLRSLGRRGILSYLILSIRGGVKPFVSRSKYIKEVFICYRHDDIIPTLLELTKTHPNFIERKPVVIACHDLAASLLDVNHDLLEQFFFLPGAKMQGQITKIMNKVEMGLLAKLNGITIPMNWSSNDLPQHFDNIIYPCITKPLVSKNGSKSEIKICKNRQELITYADLHSQSEYQVQQYIQKEFEYQLIGCSIKGGEEIIIPGRTHIIHQPINTNTAFLRYEPLDGNEPIQQCKDFIKATGYSGLFSMEFLRGIDGKNYFMEINFRNDGNAISVTAAGVNLPYIWYLSSQGLDYANELQMVHPLYVMPENVVIDLWSSGTITFRELIKDFKLRDISMDYDEADPAPTHGKWDYRMRFIIGTARYFIRVLLKLFNR